MVTSWYIQALQQTIEKPFFDSYSSYLKKVAPKWPTWIRKYLPFFKHIALYKKSEGITSETNFKFVIGRHIIVCFPRIKYEKKCLKIHLSGSVEADNKREYWKQDTDWVCLGIHHTCGRKGKKAGLRKRRSPTVMRAHITLSTTMGSSRVYMV